MARVWLITGGTSGFGRSLTEAVLARGDTVVVAARRSGALDDLAAQYPQQLTTVAIDLSDATAAASAVTEVLAAQGRIDVLVNNAGRGFAGAVEETSDAEMRDLMELHYFAPLALTRAVLPSMRERGSGAIVQMSSMGGRFAFSGVGAYCATKFALEGMSESLAHEVGPLGITIMIVEPGAFRTGFATAGAMQQAATVLPAYEATAGATREGLSGSDGTQPGDPAKAAQAILAALGTDEPPLRLALGNDAGDGIVAKLDSDRAELTRWEHLTRGVDVDA